MRHSLILRRMPSTFAFRGVCMRKQIRLKLFRRKLPHHKQSQRKRGNLGRPSPFICNSAASIWILKGIQGARRISGPAAIHITLDDGAIAFTKDVLGKITGAFFEGDGEVLLAPATEVERKQMSLFTGMAILEERFSTAYFRFNDNTAADLQPGLRAPDDAADFIAHWE